MYHFMTLSSGLLWEYDLSSFDFQKSKFIVIERVIERGQLSDWQFIWKEYGKDEIVEVARISKQLSNKDKGFTEIFVNSEFLHAA